jgi:hypothetical protein
MRQNRKVERKEFARHGMADQPFCAAIGATSLVSYHEIFSKLEEQHYAVPTPKVNQVKSAR